MRVSTIYIAKNMNFVNVFINWFHKRSLHLSMGVTIINRKESNRYINANIRHGVQKANYMLLIIYLKKCKKQKG